MAKTENSRFAGLMTGWYIWLFPLFALGITGWLLADYFRQQGPRITISFDDAGGIKAEKTRVRFRGVSIGVVQDVRISEDQKDVLVDILLRKDAERFAVEGSRFSLVVPKVTIQGVTGLDALVEGAYIAVLPGKEGNEPKAEFKAQPVQSTDPLDDTSPYVIETGNVESVRVGSSVTYRGLPIGSITRIGFAKGGRTLNVQINVENKYTWLIRDNSVFWRKIGVSAKLGLFNSEIKVNSMESIMSGGLELATPAPAGPMAKAMHRFTLASAMPKDAAAWNPVLE